MFTLYRFSLIGLGALLLCSKGVAQSGVSLQAVTPTSKNRVDAASSAELDVRSSSLFIESGTTDAYLDSEDSAWVGWGYSFDPINNQWIRKQPVAVLSVPPIAPDTPPEEEWIEAESFLNQQTSYQGFETDVSLHAAIGLLRLGASFSSSSQSGSQVFGNSFRLLWTRDYGSRIADLLAYEWEWTPQAQAVLALPEGQREAEWRRQFGEYVSVGFRSRASVELRITLQSVDSYDTYSSFLGLRASYAGASAEASFASLIEQSFQNESLTFSLHGQGVDLSNVTIPAALEQIDDPAEKQALLAEIRDAMSTASLDRGLILMPTASFPGAPLIETSQFNTLLIGDAAEEVHYSLGRLLVADSWMRPTSLWIFLQDRFPQGQTVSVADQLQLARDAVLTAMDNVWYAAETYLQFPQGGFDDDVRTSVDDLIAARIALDQLLYTFDLQNPDNLVMQLPQPTLSYSTDYSPGCHLPGCDQAWFNISIFLENVAAFGDGTVVGLEQALPAMLSTFATAPPGSDPVGDMRNFFISSVDVVASGDARGLLNLSINGQVRLHPSAIGLRVRLIDHFQREATSFLHAPFH